ncbi:MAG: ATP-binding protein [Treponema sp.]|nr:ATP-binding protein [Treponema sp.]MCL2237251.1 ATP-binding protein [Treponema sp.]
MQKILVKLWNLITHVQVLLVIAAFGLMVFFSYNFMSDIERKHLLKDVDNALTTVQTYIETDLMEPETTLGVIAENIRNMIIQGAPFEAVQSYILRTKDYIATDERLMSYAINLYGYFFVFDNQYFSSLEWVPPDDMDYSTRPWFSSALNARGGIGVTEPYVDMATGINALTFSRAIYDDDGNILAIICFAMSLDRISEFAINIHISEDSYGILLDSNFKVIAHPNPVFINRSLNQMNDGEAIQKELMEKQEISERLAIDYRGQSSVLFVRKLNNGWYLAILAYTKSYYRTVTEIGLILVLLGAVLAAALCALLLGLLHQKRKAEERTQIMLDAMPLCANFWDQNFINMDCNSEAVKLFGLSGKKEYLERFYDLSPEYQPDGKLSSVKATEFVKKAFEEGSTRFEWMHRKFSGELIPCEITLVRVKYRNTFMVCGYTRDLREIKGIMAKMREADECTQVLFDATPLSCFMIDNKMKIVECNQEIVRLFDISNKQEFFDRIFDFFPQYQPTGVESKDQILRYFDEAFEEGYCRFEWMHQKLDGEQIPTEVTLVRVKFKGEYAVAGYVRDLREIKTMIAEMRRAEIAEESSKAKSDFLAKMSHEIRTPMNAILGITEIQLQDTTIPLVTREALERIYNSGDLLLGIINDILDLSKIEAGKLELISVQYDIASLIHDTVKLNIMRYESKPIDFKLTVSENVPCTLFGDELRIKQILNNILSNAFKYTMEGQIELMLSAEILKDRDTVNLIVRVSDTGQGMTAEQVKKLGDKFSRFNMEANRKTEGTGLGMNITRNLIQLMSGEIFIESTPGMGSAFMVRLPQVCLNAEPIGKELAENLMKLNLKNTTKMRNAQITQDFMPYGRVLVVDDVETNLYVARGLMAPYGLSIDTATSGFDAVDKIRDGQTFDIIFMDHMMPRMDGIEATKLIRSLGYTGPIVALTANALAGQAEMFINNGFDDFISKPIDVRQLNGILNKLIRDKQPAEVIDEARKQKNSLYASGEHNIAIDAQLAEFFVRDARKAAAQLLAICDNNCRRVDDIANFIINVHALKSALANVGEGDVSSKAAELEQAGRDNNTQLILSSLPAFLNSLNEIIDKLDPSHEDQENEAMDEEGRVFLQEKLKAIQAACAAFDKKGAKSALADLKMRGWPKNIRDQLSAIAERLLHSEFDEASVISREIPINQ